MSAAQFVEKDLRFDFSKAISAKQVDRPDRELAECSSTIDFIVELENCLLFIEVKDPDHPRATEKAQRKFLNKMTALELARELAKNSRDSFFYEYTMGQIDKPIVFVALIELPSVHLIDMAPSDEELRKCLLVNKSPSMPDNGLMVKNSIIMDIAMWNNKFTDFPVTRISAGSN